jgi:hypothetical protein
MSARRKWDAALRVLVQDDDGKPLAKLLRKGRCILLDGVFGPQMPVDIAFALAELFDPHCPTSPFVKRSLPNEALKAAYEALMVECERLVEIYHKQVKKGGDKLRKRDITALKEFAKELDDRKALRAFADHRKAQNKFMASMLAINPAVRLTIKPLSKVRRERLQRDEGVVGEMLAATLKGQRVGDAAKSVSEKV